MAKEFRARNLTYAPFEMDFSSSDLIDDLKREIGNEHSSELQLHKSFCSTNHFLELVYLETNP